MIQVECQSCKAPYELDTQRRLITLLENSGREADALRQYEEVIRVAPGEPRFQLELQIRSTIAVRKRRSPRRVAGASS